MGKCARSRTVYSAPRLLCPYRSLFLGNPKQLIDSIKTSVHPFPPLPLLDPEETMLNQIPRRVSSDQHLKNEFRPERAEKFFLSPSVPAGNSLPRNRFGVMSVVHRESSTGIWNCGARKEDPPCEKGDLRGSLFARVTQQASQDVLFLNLSSLPLPKPPSLIPSPHRRR